jgi:hypothetical protein
VYVCVCVMRCCVVQTMTGGLIRGRQTGTQALVLHNDDDVASGCCGLIAPMTWT